MADTDRSHLLPFPIWITVLRAFQLALSIVILGLAAYVISISSFDGIDLNMFTAIETMITVVYILVATFAMPIAYNYWAILGLDMLAVLFWLVSFALLASETSNYKSNFDDFYSCAYEYDGYCYDKRDIQKRDATISDYYHVLIATAVLGALEFVLFIITLVFSSIWLHRHRKAGGHCLPSNNMHNTSSAQPKPVASNDETGIPMTNIANP